MNATIFTGPKPDYPERELTEEDIARWDKNMKRAFKGVVLRGRPMARSMLFRTSAARDA